MIGTADNVHTMVDSPIGPLTVIARGGALTGLLMHDERRVPPPVTPGRRDDAALAAVAELLNGYFAGALTDFDVPLDPVGTPFQRRAWAALRAIPYGETISYGELASRMGRPDAARAVGSANNRNPIGIVIPCHRVVGADGQLVGYGGGLERKRWLLDHEARVSHGLLTLPW